MQSCCVEFIDCAGYWDLISQILNVIFILIIFYKTTNNYHDLMQQKTVKTDLEIQKSIKRKISVNVISMIYQFSLLFTVLFSITIFLEYKNNSQQIKQKKLNSWYKWSQIIFINLLNSLNLTVGFLYWKAVRAYYTISQMKVPFIYSNFFKGIFIIVYGLNLIIIILSLVLLLICQQTTYSNSQIKILNILNAFSVLFSTLMCVISRILYQRDILNTIKMSRTAVKKQMLYSVVLSFCCLCRIFCVILNLIEVDYTMVFRYFNSDCLDQMPYHALFILFYTLSVNLLPPFIFSIIFSSNQRRRKYTSQIQQILRKNQIQDSTQDL